MTELLAIVRSADEALVAADGGADATAIAIGSGPVEAPARLPPRCGPMLAETHRDPVDAVAAAAAAGFDRVWLPLGPAVGVAIAAAIARRLDPILTVPLGHPLDEHLCNAALAAGASEMLVAGEPFGPVRVLDSFSSAALAGFLTLARRRGLQVGFAGSLEAPDIPRLMALAPATLGLDTLLRDDDDRLGADRLRAARLLWADAPPRPAPLDHEPDRIFIRDWTVPMSIGAYASEKGALQRVRFTIDVDLAPASAGAAGMAEVVSYDLITDAVERVAAGHVDFVETAAEHIAATLLAPPRVLRVAVLVEKLDRGPGGVGCRIVRRRPS